MRLNIIWFVFFFIILQGILFDIFPQVSIRYADKLAMSIEPKELIVYKNISNQELNLHILESSKNCQNDNETLKPCIIGIHGGGWTGGNPSMVYPILQEFADNGWVGVSVEYRLLDSENCVTIYDCIKDVKSAIRYVKYNAEKLGVDTTQIVLTGLSAGGHLAVSAVLFDSINEEPDNIKIPVKPQYMLLYYSVLDTSLSGYGAEKIGDDWQKVSPLHNIRDDMPPILLFHGMKDKVVPIDRVINFQKEMVSHGNSCDLIINGQGNHGYFLYSKPLFEEVISQTFSFLKREF